MITEVNTNRHAIGYTLAMIGLTAVDGRLARL